MEQEIKVGDYIRGFECKPCQIKINEKYVGFIAEVIEVNFEDIDILVKFSDGFTWHYPYNEAIEHLCNEDMEMFEKGLDANAKDPLLETPFHKPDFSHVKEKAEKGVDITFESKSTNDLKLESLKREQQQNPLYSVYLSLGKVRIIYIDQDEQDIECHKKNNPNWHIIVVKQEQDKGIQIVIKE